MTDDLELGDIQGHVVPGFNKPHQAHILVHFPDRGAGQNWLQTLRHGSTWDITSAEEIETFKSLRKLAEQRRADDESRIRLISSTWLNVAFSWRGLHLLLGCEGPDVFGGGFREETFKENCVTPPDGSRAEIAVHALIMVGADQATHLAEEVELQHTRLAECGAVVVETFTGAELAGGREHFGYVDGLSQPTIAGAPGSSKAGGPPVNPGEFVIGYPTEAGQPDLVDPGLERNGSFVVLLKLKQHVADFRKAVRAGASRAGWSELGLESAIVGRSPDGDVQDPPVRRLAHIGRAHPDPAILHGDNPERHRLIRRGIPYGPPLESEREEDDGIDRGLLFVAFQASIPSQFEHVWLNWLNNRDFPFDGVGNDPLTGRVRGSAHERDVQIANPDVQGERAHFRLPQFVSLEYGGYFFTPSISALARIAGVPERAGTPAHVVAERTQDRMANQSIYVPKDASSGKFDYVTLVLDENPYDIDPNGVTLPGTAETGGPFAAYRRNNGYPNGRSLNDFLQAVQATRAASTYSGATGDPLTDFPHWDFNGQSVRISKALRLTYTYAATPSDPYKKNFQGVVLIGYGGPSFP
jgi:Dyp-type peroxidase family